MILLIGFGSIGKRYAEIINKKKKLYIYDLYKKKDSRYNFLSDLKNLDRLQLTHIIIATPPDTHVKIAKSVLYLRLPILIEKPLSNNLIGVSA